MHVFDLGGLGGLIDLKNNFWNVFEKELQK